MENYEAIFIVNPNLNDKDIDAAISEIDTILKKNGATIKHSEKMGKRKLAYKIKKFREGIYYRADFEVKPAAISEVKNIFRLNPNIIRFLILNKERLMV